MSLEIIHALVKTDLNAVDELIKTELVHDANSLIHDISAHLIGSGGKRLRPLTVILGTKLFGYQGDVHLHLAAAMEFFHSATLLHDDVIDESKLRRGKTTAHHIWNTKACVLVGDFLFTRSFQLLIAANNARIYKLIADTSNTITRGEVMQLIHARNPNTTEQDYFEVIKNKTAILFSAAAQLGSLLTTQSEEMIDALKQYGLHLGNAFQLVDDMLDYSGDTQLIGKNIGDDLSEGKVTLPLIYAMKHGTQHQQKILKDAILNGNTAELDNILNIIHETKALVYTHDRAKAEIISACAFLKNLPKNEYAEALNTLATSSLERDF